MHDGGLSFNLRRLNLSDEYENQFLEMKRD